MRFIARDNTPLGGLVILAAARRISWGEAAVLGCLAQLLLVSVKGVSKEVWATKIDRTKDSDPLRRILT